MRLSTIKKLLLLTYASYTVTLTPTPVVTCFNQPTKTFGFPFFKQRPQIFNIPRRMSGELHHIFRPDLKYVNGSISLIPEYTRSFNSTELGKYIFFNDTNSMQFGAPDTSGVDVAAREFLLGDDFQAMVTTKPIVQNFIIEFAFRLGLDEWIPRVYFDLHTPITWTKWDLDFKETSIAAGTGQIAQGEVGNNTAAVNAPYNSIIQAWTGQNTVQDVVDTMNFASVDGGQTKMDLADMEFIIGYNFILHDWVHFGANLRVIAPTSNNPSGVYLFEPLAGNASHAAVGGGIDGHFEYSDSCKEQSLSFYYFANMYHMFDTQQPRTFDLLLNGPGSRYLLFKQFNDLNLYNNIIEPGPNVLTLPANVKIGLEAEATFMLNYKHCNWSVDVGYDIWGRTREHITIVQLEDSATLVSTSSINPTTVLSTFTLVSPSVANAATVITTSDGYTWGVKGDTNTIDPTNIPPGYTGPATANYTASQATISGANAGPDIDPTTGQPTTVFLTYGNLDVEGAQARGTFSQKIFAYVGHTWPTCDLSPYIGIGGEIEFSGKGDTALSQWGLWIKGGFYFE